MQNDQLKKIYYLNIGIYCHLVVQGLKTSFGPIEPKRLNQPVSLESQLQFSQTRPDFIQNQQVNPRNSSIVKVNLHLGIQGLKTSSGLICPKDLSSCSPESYFQYSQTRLHFIQNNKTNQMNLSHVVLHCHLAWSLSAQHAEM